MKLPWSKRKMDIVLTPSQRIQEEALRIERGKTAEALIKFDRELAQTDEFMSMVKRSLALLRNDKV